MTKFNKPPKLTVPQKSLSDTSKELIKAVGSGIPAVSVFASLIQTNEQIEMGFFFKDVANSINNLQGQMSELSTLHKAIGGDEKATEVIIKSWRGLGRALLEAHDDEKKEALKAAACSIAMSSNDGTGTVDHEFYLRLVREFDAIHIKLLRAAEHGMKVVTPIIDAIDGGRMMAAAVPEGGNAFTTKVAEGAWKDLYNHGLVNTDSVRTMMTPSGYESDRRTSLGVRFLSFISN